MENLNIDFKNQLISNLNNEERGRRLGNLNNGVMTILVIRKGLFSSTEKVNRWFSADLAI